MTLATHPHLRLVVFGALYLAQGVPTGFVTITLAARLAARGYGTGAVAGLLSVTLLPWALKIAYGLLLDGCGTTRFGRRRPWILFAQCGMLLSLAVLVAVPNAEQHLVVLGALLFVHNAFGALQDVATDATAVDLLDADERARTNGVMWSSKVFGLLIGGAGLSTVVEGFGFRAALLVQVGLLAAVALLVLVVREHPAGTAPHAPPTPCRVLLGALAASYRDPFGRTVAHLALVASLPTRMLITVGPIFAVQEAGWTDPFYARFAGGPALLAGIAGAAGGGWAVHRLGRRRVLAGAAAAIAVLLATFAAARPAWTSPTVVMAFFASGVLLDMTLKTALTTLFMDATGSQQADARATASLFTVYLTLSNLCNVTGSLLVVALDPFLDFRGLFLFAALAGAGVCWLFTRLPALQRSLP